jgi:hypothetical protein
MSDIDPNEHEEIARRLREDGPVQAPSDLAGEVMKRVRTEPRRSTSAVRRPLVTLLAAALVTAALVAGIAKLGGGSASSAGGGSTGGGASEAHAPSLPGDSVAGAKVVQRATVSGVPRAALLGLTVNGIQLSTAYGPNGRCALNGSAFEALHPYTLDVSFAAWESVQAQLDTARKAAVPAAAPLVSVRLRRLARGVTTPGALTCP